MRKNIHRYIGDFVVDNLALRLNADTFSPRLNFTDVLELGSLVVAGQEHLSIRNYFDGFQYTGIDFREGNGVDIVANIEDLSIYKDKSFGVIICCDTLEHVKNPIKAVAEMKRLLKGGGVIIITSVFNFQIHDYPHDYWRFTPECFRELLSGFFYVNVQAAGAELNPHTVVGVASNVCWKVPTLQQDTRYERFIRRYTSPFIQDKINFIRRKAGI